MSPCGFDPTFDLKINVGRSDIVGPVILPYILNSI